MQRSGVLVAVCLVLMQKTAFGMDDTTSEEFCRQFPQLHLCRLHDTLKGSLVELQYLLQDTEQLTAGAVAETPRMEKRKSAFVRFGKRSSPDAMEMEKRKSAFVRFGRSLGESAEKRKSQYIRFGRK